MNHNSRRQWLKTVGLSGGFAFLGTLDGIAGLPSSPSWKPGDLVRLHANENPYGPSSRVRQALTDTFDEACRYPFAALGSLLDMLAEKEGLSRDHIVITGGSTEGLNAAGLLHGMKEGEIIAADPTFHTLMEYGERFGGRVHRVPLNADLQHDLEAMAARINKNTRLIFLCNPNNPTGTLLGASQLTEFCNRYEKQALIFSDEAYYDYITEPDYPSMVSLIAEGKNIIVSRTFSKVYGLAGLRIGYLIAQPPMAGKLRASLMANTNMLAIAAAREALKDTEFYKHSLLSNAAAKQLLYEQIGAAGLEYIPSHTNFVFFKTDRPIGDFRASMEKEGVLIGRPFPPLTHWARVSTGTREQMELFGRALHKVMG